ncbi:MAG TPA: kynureninase [Gammaproteobacteria bacterium]|nr:kynureninase [Gammaproteobacteria bacterium]
MKGCTQEQATLEHAQFLDKNCALISTREEFNLPPGKMYLCGHSLGPMPKKTNREIDAILNHWATSGVSGYLEGQEAWAYYAESLLENLALLTGAHSRELVIMNSLTVNLHLMLATFYKPTKERYKILVEEGIFPTDKFALESHSKLHDSPPDPLLFVKREENGLISTEHILRMIEAHHDNLALVLMPCVQYATGQVINIKSIAESIQSSPIILGVDAAHAVGNIPLQLHDWNVDFGVWCHYKYMNAGPGAVAGCFIHERHVHDVEKFRLGGWWALPSSVRLTMSENFLPDTTARGWQLSCPAILSLAPLKASLELFKAVTLTKLRQKSQKLTEFFVALVNYFNIPCTLVTPLNRDQHGNQLSLTFGNTKQEQVYDALLKANICVDMRKPNLIRITFNPFYNTYSEVFTCVQTLKNIVRVL